MTKMTSEAILVLLAQRHPAQEWAFYCELPNGTGYHKTRTLDAYAVCCWAKPGVGWSVAYEVKVSKADFKKELEDPTKRKDALLNSNEFYFVAPVGIIPVESVPESCGLIEVCGDQLEGGLCLKVKKIAVQRDHVAYTPAFFASLMRASDGRKFSNKPDQIKAWKYCGTDFDQREFESLINKFVEERLRTAQTEALARLERDRNNKMSAVLYSFFAKLADLVNGHVPSSYGLLTSLPEVCASALVNVERAVFDPGVLKREKIEVALSVTNSLRGLIDHGTTESTALDSLQTALRAIRRDDAFEHSTKVGSLAKELHKAEEVS